MKKRSCKDDQKMIKRSCKDDQKMIKRSCKGGELAELNLPSGALISAQFNVFWCKAPVEG